MNASDQQLTIFGLPLPYISIVITVVLAIANFLYTRRTFQATNIPELEIVLTDMVKTRLVQTHFPIRTREVKVTLRNLHSSVHVTDLSILLAVADPFREWRFWKKQWFSLAGVGRGQLQSIPPQQSIGASIRPSDSFEKCLAEELPDIIREVNANSPNYPNMTTFQLARPHALKLRLIASYRPAMPGAGFRKCTQNYWLFPKCMEDKGCEGFLTDWFPPRKII